MELSRKAALLFAYLQKTGGGSLDEWRVRDRTGLSHGSIVAARRELVAAGLVTLSKSCRHFVYALTGQGQSLPETAEAAADKPPAAPAESLSPAVSSESMRQAEELSVETVQEAEAKHAPRGGDFFFASPMPHVAGTFFDFDEWTDALMNALGDCLDISESLVEEGTYTVYSHDFESEDTYHTETTSEGFIVN